MKKKMGILNGKGIIPAAGALLVLVLISLLISQTNMEADAAEFYNVTDLSAEMVQGSATGTVTNGQTLTHGDVLFVAALNETGPNLTTDFLVIDIIVNNSQGIEEYIVFWSLHFNGTGNNFTGNLSLDKDLSSDSSVDGENITLRIADGYNISFRKHHTANEPLLHFNVDTIGPSITPVEPNEWFTVYKGNNYASRTGKLNLTITDTDKLVDQSWLVDNNKVTYRWDMGTNITWDGNAFALPQTEGPHSLNVVAVDRLGYETNFSKRYSITTFLTSGTTITTSESYASKMLFVSDLKIGTGGSLSIFKCDVIFLNSGSKLTAQKGGTVSLLNSSFMSKGDLFHVETNQGSTFTMTNCQVFVPQVIPINSDLFELNTGTLTNVTVWDLSNRITIRSGGVTLQKSKIDMEPTGSLYIDTNHTWEKEQIKVTDTQINGTSANPIIIRNGSVWQPYDVTGNVYYHDIGTIETTLFWNTTNITAPYVKIPHFIDSRSNQASFKIEYNNSGTWTSFPGFPVSNVIYDEWISGTDAEMDLSMLLEGDVQLRFNWSNPDGSLGCIYIGEPKAGSSGGIEYGLGSGNFGGDMSGWTPDRVSGNMILLRNVSMEDAADAFLHVESSGRVLASQLRMGVPGKSFQAQTMVRSINSSMSLESTQMVGSLNTDTAYHQRFKAGNDWAISYLKNTNITTLGSGNFESAILVQGGWLNMERLIINDTMTGVQAETAMVSAKYVYMEPESYGMKIEVPLDYPSKASMDITGVTITSSWNRSAFHLTGGNIQYDLQLNLLDYDIDSDDGQTFSRNDPVGAIYLNLEGSSRSNARLRGNITQTPSHGIYLPGWSSGGRITIDALSRITNAGLDGINIGDDVDVNISARQIRNCTEYGIYAGDGGNINIVSGGGFDVAIKTTSQGGIIIGDDSRIYMKGVNISESLGWGFQMGENGDLRMVKVSVYSCEYGVRISDGSAANLAALEVQQSLSGTGLYSQNSDITITRSDTERSKFLYNYGQGVFIEGGSIYINFTNIEKNGDTGLKLWNTELNKFHDVKIQDNLGDGLYIYIGSNAVMDASGYYGKMTQFSILNNDGIGLTASLNPTAVTKTVEMEIGGFLIGGNRGGDIISPKQMHILWKASTTSRDILGSETATGVTRSNLDIIVSFGMKATLLNQNITLMSNGNGFVVESSGTLTLDAAYIRPAQSSHRFYVKGMSSSSIQVYGGYLGQLYRLEMKSGLGFYMDGTLVKYGEGPIYLENTPFDILNSEFNSIDGNAITISGGQGNIMDTKFSSNIIGIRVDGLSDDMLIEDSQFIGNNWGLYLFDDSNRYINITECSFSDNSPAPIWTNKADAFLLDTEIVPSKVRVTQTGQNVIIKYTLTVKLINEKGELVRFNLALDRGPGTSYNSYPDQSGTFTNQYEVYRVNLNQVQDKGVSVDLTITYVEGKKNGVDIYGEISDSFMLDKRTSNTYYGYKAPTVVQIPSILEATEDVGLDDSPVDVSKWFTDIGTDKGNLTFSARSQASEIVPKLEGSLLSIQLKKDWNGEGILEVTATDPHGKSLTVEVVVIVIPENDQPVATNLRIEVKGAGSLTVPRTGDTIIGVWNWFDIDGDPEPPTHIIRWYLNGTLQPNLNNKEEILNVFAGQIWNFTLYPWDQIKGYYGEPANSPPIMVGNQPPTLKSVSLSPTGPNTLTDIIAEPSGGEDVETGAVVYSYIWEKKAGSSWVALGAPNSPILDHMYTKKGDQIRVSVWASDGLAISPIRRATVEIKNSPPQILSAKLMPEVVDENTDLIWLTDIEMWDPDQGDHVNLFFDWNVSGVTINIDRTLNQIQYSQGGWIYPASISVGITPFDGKDEGNTFTLTTILIPTDTDGDGKPDDADGDDFNDPGDDKDDDNDGFNDDWELELGTDPKDPLSKPTDTDGDGLPNGDATNSKEWMDIDDDNDGVYDIHPEYPQYFDTFPTVASRPGDFDGDGIGDDQDPDIDDDKVPNEKDADPYNPYITTKDEVKENFAFQIIIIILLVLIIAAIAVAGYLIYNGTIKLPTTAPPPIDEGAEAIYESGERVPKTAKLPPKSELMGIEEMEELDNMRVCSSCGELVTLDDELCPSCGATFEDSEDEEESEEGDWDDDEEEE
ncbi:MAG: right-handed parallel beta-helix repeat-containing protein [Thermoplasmatota archaeon]